VGLKLGIICFQQLSPNFVFSHKKFQDIVDKMIAMAILENDYVLTTLVYRTAII